MVAVTPITPRRSTRGQLFTPSPTPTTSRQPENTTYTWLSAPKPPTSSTPPTHTYYTSFTRIVHRASRLSSAAGLSPAGKKKVRAGKGDDESRFSVGDGVAVVVTGGNDGIGVLTALWEEPDEDDEDEDEDEGEGKKGRKESEDDEEEEDGEKEKGTRMMAEIHWFFRRQDLPSVMKNVQVEDNEVLLAASPNKPVTTRIPVQLLSKTIPIYSRTVFKEQFPDSARKTQWKGWSYAQPTGVYWCDRAYDKGARGGKLWKVDVDEWRGKGRAGMGWQVDVKEESEEEEEGSECGSESGSEVGSGESEEESGEDEGEDEEEGEETMGKRKRIKGAAGKPRQAKRAKQISSRVKATKSAPRRGRPPSSQPKRNRRARVVPHPKSLASQLPSTLRIEELPTDPYQRALRLLHVGATPESLPCREEEFVDVLSKVEEGVESGGGGCLYIAGVPGTGKTATVHAVVKELKRKAEDGELTPFSYVEINGLKIPSPQHAYVVLWEAISGAKGCSAKTALRGLESHFGRKTNGVRGPRGHTFVVLMDELDQLLTAKQDVVYNFFNWPTMRDSQLFVVAVANRMDLPQHLAAKIKSRLGLQTLLFQPYDRANLIDIVGSRLIEHPGSKEDHKVLQPDAIALAATKMAGTNGDARRVLDACRRAVEVAIEAHKPPHPVTAREMVSVLNAMSSSPVALFVKQCSMQQKMMMAAVVRCVRREGVPEIPWRSVRNDHDALTRSLAESNDLLSNSELALVLSSLISTHALTRASADVVRAAEDERRVALGMEIGEVGRVLMNEGEGWRRALAGV